MKRNEKDLSNSKKRILRLIPKKLLDYNKFYDDYVGFETQFDEYTKTKKRKNVVNILSVIVLMGIIFGIFILIINYGYVFPEYSINRKISLKQSKSDISNNNVASEYDKNIYTHGSINKKSENKTESLIRDKDYDIVSNSGIKKSNPSSNNNLESFIYNICLEYDYYDYSKEKIYNINRTIFYYIDFKTSRKVARKVFIEADKLDRDYVKKVRTNKYTAGADIYLNDGNSYYFIISIRYKSIFNDSVYIPSEFDNVQLLEKKMSIIVDDVGDTLQYRDFLRLDIPLTFAIIPLREKSTNAAHEIALFDKHSIIIHAPFESGYKDKEDVVTFYIEDDDYRINKKLDDFIQSVPYAIGMNNHQGSLATADEQFMDRFMKIYSKKNLCFIDSMTTDESVAYDKAILNGVYALKRDVFLDNHNNYEYIEKMFNRCMYTLSKKEYVVVIGHSTKNETLKFFQDRLEKINEKEFSFINIKRLIKIVYGN